MANKHAIDFATFEHAPQCDENKPDMGNCKCIDRVIYSLKYYTKLNTKTDEKERIIFVEFIQGTYPNYLNDIIHLTTAHDDDLERIHNLLFTKYKFKACDIGKCILSSRHSTVNKRNKINHNDEIFAFYQSKFDSLHYYLFHLFESGLRSMQSDIDDLQQTDQIIIKNDDLSQCFDQVFSRQKQKIQERRAKVSKFLERDQTENTKFNLQADVVKSKKTAIDDDATFLTGLFEEISNDKAQALYLYLCQEEYDTDALYGDIEIYQYSNNISNISYVMNTQILAQISNFIEVYKLQGISFSTGFVFWYWPYYDPSANIEQEIKTDLEKEDESKDSSGLIKGNDNDFGGFSTTDLYVPKKHSSFKDEIFQYDDIGAETYRIEVLMKSKEYLNTMRARKIKARKPESRAARYYEIKEDDPFTQAHIMALIMYCAFTDLCTAFSCTFRRIKALETLKSVKERHRDYWWFSKLLREAVEFYGDSRKRWDMEEQLNVNAEPGPFYCGLSVNLLMPSFNIRLNGPTSTTKAFEVSVRFAKNNGIIMQLNNTYSGGGCHQRFFNVVWLSPFAEENERFTIGGSFALQIESVRKTATKQNFKRFFQPLFYLDAILSGSYLGDMGLKDNIIREHLVVIKRVIGHATGTKPFGSKIDEYMLNTINMFCSTKKTISIDAHRIDKYCPQKITNILFESLSEMNVADNKSKSRVNLPKIQILNMFNNVENIIIYSTGGFGNHFYSFSLSAMLDLLNELKSIQNGKRVKCIVHGVWVDRNNREGKRSWLFTEYSSFPIESNKYSMSLTIHKDHWDRYNDVLTIDTV